MIKAFRIVAETVPKAKLWIIGNVQKLNSRFQLITEADKDKIVCWGWQPLGVLYDLIIKADVALLPHLKNLNSDYGIPNKLFQYMMVGKPVITSNCIPIERIIRETGAGLGYEYDNVKDLAEKMIYMFKNRTEINNLGKKGREAVLRKYNWKAEETNLLAAYNHVHMIRQNKKKE